MVEPDEPDNLARWWEYIEGDRQQKIQHVTSAAVQIGSLPERVYDPALPRVVRQACLESFLMNARLLIEFFTRKNSQDFSVWDIIPDWQPGPPEVVARLNDEVWNATSKHVVHLSKKRLRERRDPPPTFDRSPHALAAIREDLLVLLRQWEPALVAAQSAHWEGRYPVMPSLDEYLEDRATSPDNLSEKS